MDITTVIIVALIAIAFNFSFGGFIVSALVEWLLALGFEKTEGRVVLSEVSRHNRSTQANIHYTYQVNGKTFTGSKVHPGMIVGEHSRGEDLDVNPLKSKQLTNFRAAGKDDAVTLTPPIPMTLERAIAYIEDDELVEVTPKSIRLRKRFLDPEDRKRAKKQAAAAAAE